MSDVTFWYTGDELATADDETLINLIAWCIPLVNFRPAHQTERHTDMMILLHQTIQECNLILEERATDD